MAEGVCIPRSALYMHYLDFSEKHDTQPVNAASFGKVGSKTQQSAGIIGFYFFLKCREDLDICKPQKIIPPSEFSFAVAWGGAGGGLQREHRLQLRVRQPELCACALDT